ncbi:MAG TPA: hypothetical protein VG318_17235 [Actinomycetota bacterium]|nr:hypothetical protein [Actinomycetota bacterium]
MHPVILGQVAQDHVRSLIEEADANRLGRIAGGSRSPRLRRRVGLGLIAVGNRLACEPARGLAGVPGGRA